MPIKSSPEVDPEAVALIRKALLIKENFNYIDQHRGPQERTNEKVLDTGKEKSHKGDVKDPEHDRRLSENKNREKKERDKREEAETNKKKEEQNRKKRKLMELKSLTQKVNPSLKRSAAGKFGPGTKITRPIQPPSRTPTPTPGVAASAPAPAPPAATGQMPPRPMAARPPSGATPPGGAGLPPSQRPGPTADQMAERENQLLSGPVGKTVPFGGLGARKPGGGFQLTPGMPGYIPPKVESKPVYQKQIDQVRKNPYGNALLGENAVGANDSRFDKVRQRLQQKQNEASSIQERNEIQIKLSKMAVELIKAGKLNIT